MYLKKIKPIKKRLPTESSIGQLQESKLISDLSLKCIVIALFDMHVNKNNSVRSGFKWCIWF